MKKPIATLIFLVMISISFAQCKSKSANPKTQKTAQNANRVWMLIAFKDFDKQFLIDAHAELNLTNTQQASAKMGCNTLSFPYKMTRSKINFSSGIATLMACDDMKLEEAFSKAMVDFTSYTIEGHTLTLTNSKKEKMVFVAQDWD
jgi:heat shock protein HslJ